MLAQRIMHFYENFANGDASKTCCHFTKEGFQYKTISRILTRCIERKSTKLLPKHQHSPPVSKDEVIEDVRHLFESNPNVSVRTAAQSLDIAKSTLQDIKKKKLGINAYSKQIAPKYREGQEARAKSGCRSILYMARGKEILMDDETYVTNDSSEVHGKEYYHATNINNIENRYKFKHKQKFPKRFLVWQLVDSRGNICSPFVTTKTMTAKIYLDECIKKRLWPFIKKYHPDMRILFWPDLARCHYARIVTKWLSRKGINFVQERRNAPNVPQARPIERFWALCKRSYRKLNVLPKSVRSFATYWRRISQDVAQKSLRKLMCGVRKKLRLIRDGSVFDAVS